jgi:hypothetical protein
MVIILMNYIKGVDSSKYLFQEHFKCQLQQEKNHIFVH